MRVNRLHLVVPLSGLAWVGCRHREGRMCRPGLFVSRTDATPSVFMPRSKGDRNVSAIDFRRFFLPELHRLVRLFLLQDAFPDLRVDLLDVFQGMVGQQAMNGGGKGRLGVGGGLGPASFRRLGSLVSYSVQSLGMRLADEIRVIRIALFADFFAF